MRPAIFPIAPMCKVIRTFTVIALLLPGLLLIGALWSALLLIPAILVAAIYAWIWLGFRPTRFVVTPDAVEIIWPLKRRGVVQMYVSRVDQFVWIERYPARAWLITPDNPQAFVEALAA